MAAEPTNWRERLLWLIKHEPQNRAQLMELLRSAVARHLIDSDALSIIEGALQVSELQVRDVMVQRAQMDVVSIDAPLNNIVDTVIEAAHSRFPVIGENRDDVIGILLAKELLRLLSGKEESLRETLRPAVFVPESKRLNVLLREFRVSRNHMAIVVDEYGGVAGLVTIEDVLELIVGEIEDEYDFDETADNIVLDNAGLYRVKGITELSAFNEHFHTQFSDENYDTVGGLVSHHLGRLPKRHEVMTIDGLRIRVLRADSRRVHTLLVHRPSHIDS